MRTYDQFVMFNFIIVALMTVAYFYQAVYMFVGWKKRKAPELPAARVNHRYAAFISARNERGVIGELIDSLMKQNYPKDLFDVYVLADNCTDDTAAVSRQHGATVYERFDKQNVGKGYALDYLYKHVTMDRGVGYYDGFFVFDADNIVDPQFVAEMNKTFDTGRFDAVTCYRNSKNFGTNWLSAAYSIWFLREARYVNYPRMLLGTSCMISGTGFLVSGKLMEENHGWPYHLLTEDIQFSVNCALNGHMIGYCDRAMVYDEQPTTWSQSWKQRLRWSKGFYQIDGHRLLPAPARIHAADHRGHRPQRLRRIRGADDAVLCRSACAERSAALSVLQRRQLLPRHDHHQFADGRHRVGPHSLHQLGEAEVSLDLPAVHRLLHSDHAAGSARQGRMDADPAQLRRAAGHGGKPSPLNSLPNRSNPVFLCLSQ